MNFTLADLLFSIVIFQLLFTGSYLFIHPGSRKTSNRLFGAFFFSIGLNLIDNFLVIKRVYLFSPYYVSWGICLPLLFGPLLYLYTRSVLYKSFTLSRSKWLHFIPFLTAFLATELYYLCLPRKYLQSLLNDMKERRVPSIFYWTSGIIYLQYFIYLTLCLRLMEQYKKVVQENYSDPRRADLRWLYTTILFFSFCMFLTAFNGFLGLTVWSKFYYLIFGGIIGLLFVFIYRILIATLMRPAIFDLLEKPAAGDLVSRTSPRSFPPSEMQNSILTLLEKEMRESKPYLDPDLNLEQLAKRLSLRPKILSRVINDQLHQHFFDFINSYRIEEAKRLLSDPADSKITVLEILYQCGFNSKSSFNTLFKRYTGMTPTLFRKAR